MSDLNFSLKDCDEVLKNYLQTDLRTKDFEIIPRQGDNYIFKITTEDPTTTLTFYAKPRSQPPQIEKILREESFASTITPRFVCGKSGLLFFEDLTCQKFQTNPNPKSFDLKHVQIALNVLAQFHAAAFAYERDTKNLKEEYDLEDANFDVAEAEDTLWSLLDNEDKERVEEIREDLRKKQEATNFAKVLCHSNLTWTNILFHYENGVPNECRLLNFKAKLYAPPLYDVLQLIFFNTNEDFRRCHYDTLLPYYHKRLREELQKYGLDIDNISSFEDFKLSSYELLPLIKLEAVKVKKDKLATQALKEILTFPRLTREDCYVVVKNVINTIEYDFLSFDILPEESHHKLTIKIRLSSQEKIINCCVKRQSCFIYDTFLPKLENLSINVVNNCFRLCYFRKTEELLLEDLNDHRVLTEPFDFNLLSMVVKKLAQFHAGTVLLEEEMSQRLKIDYRVSSDHGHHFENLDRHLDLKTIKVVADLFPEFKTKLEDQNVIKSLTFCDRFRKVISLGSISNEDILIKFDDERPVDCRFINCQDVTYRPAACDFLSVLYSTTDKPTRLKNEEELKKIYYRELGNIVSSCKHKVEQHFPYEEFAESLESCRLKIMMQEIAAAGLATKDELNDLLETCCVLPNV